MQQKLKSELAVTKFATPVVVKETNRNLYTTQAALDKMSEGRKCMLGEQRSEEVEI